MNRFEFPENYSEPYLEKAHERAVKALTASEVKMEDFSDIYDVKRDREYIEEMERRFDDSPEEKERKKFSDILEAILLEEIELGNWLGQEAETFKTSKYDDIKNGVDAIVEFDEGEKRASYLGLAIDVTYSTDISKKMQKIKEGIDNDKLPSVKYFKSGKIDVRGEISKIPEVIIGVDRKKAQELIEAWMQKDRKKLESLPVKNIIISEIMMQLDRFKNYASKIGRSEIAIKYSQVKKMIQASIGEKQKLPEEDRVLEGIDSFTRKL